MTSVSAAVIALFVGAAAALLLYYIPKKKSESLWILAFFRLAWMGLLVYAIIAPERQLRQAVNRPKVLWILEDTSKSVAGDARAVADRIKNDHQGDGLQCIISPYNEEAIPQEQPWIYIGDGHLESTEPSTQPPVGMYILEANPIHPPRLLQGISAPQRVVAGSNFPFHVLIANEQVDVQVYWNNSRVSSLSGELTAPIKLGAHKLEARATMGDQSDQMLLWIEVDKEYRKVGIQSETSHPHEMMVRRWANKRRYNLVNGSLSDNIITIGKTSAPADKEVLALAGGLPESFTVAQVYKPEKSKLPKKVKLWTLDDSEIDFSKVHWYRSALEDENVTAVFEDHLDQFIARTTPPTILFNGKEDLIVGERAEWTLALVGSDGLPEAAMGQVEIWKGEEQVDAPVLVENETGIFSFAMNLTEAGIYRVRMSMLSDDNSYKASASVHVEEGDIEAIRPYNQRLMNHWIQKAHWVANDTSMGTYPNWEIGRERMELITKKPQHYTWWYWGLVLSLATSEWILRRRQGWI
jgi:hypothetical protein